MSQCTYPNCDLCGYPDECRQDLSYKAEKQREYNARHPERVRESSRQYYLKNKDSEVFKTRQRENHKRWVEKQKEKVS